MGYKLLKDKNLREKIMSNSCNLNDLDESKLVKSFKKTPTPRFTRVDTMGELLERCSKIEAQLRFEEWQAVNRFNESVEKLAALRASN